DVAAQVNGLGRFDAVIHNAAVGYREPHHLTADGLPHVFSINTLAAHILTALIERPKRLVYPGPRMHPPADANLDELPRPSGAGTDRRRTPRASCTMRCWPSPSRAAGPMCCPMP